MVPVKIIYGPYESNGIIRHKKQRLWGVCKKLSTLGFTCELIPCDHYERLYIQMLARDIFQCNIKQLKFNCPHEDDVLCQRIVECVKEAHTRYLFTLNIKERLGLGDSLMCQLPCSKLTGKLRRI